MPPLFRLHRPQRRPNITERASYQAYRSELREDFQSKCGYCNDDDSVRIRAFAIDHFIPRNPKGWSHAIAPNNYNNLVYSCHFCNSSKSNKWPTERDDLHHHEGLGFVDPVNEEYDTLFTRNKSGGIVSTGIGPADYIFSELKFWLPIHSLNWKFNQIRSLVSLLEAKIELIEDAAIKSEAMGLLRDLKAEGFDLVNNGIFREND